ncbi:MAG: pseudouridine-5'-phosphate glycosidase [Phycisphaeraceae bacterium]|nr:pseudouridine-5'-phosphate glycosidase [Phycisphaeraceae bacterium]
MEMINRAGLNAVGLETTLLVHGVPRGQGERLARELSEIVREAGAMPAFVGIFHGRGVVGMDFNELNEVLLEEHIEKANSANMGVLMHRGQHGATTVSATMELCAAAGVRVFATGGIGGVHKGYGERWDVSSDLAALARFPVAVVASGVKSLLDVTATREVLETLGVPVVGFRTERFPAFYLRDGGCSVDAVFGDEGELARYLAAELRRTGRGILVANPIAESDEIARRDWDRWIAEAEKRVGGADGRNVTPRLLAALHEVSGGATLRANLALVRGNAKLAGALAVTMGS